MARMTPPERRTAIVAAALEVMVHKGIGATTVRDVADRMGTSSGLVHHYFATMDDLLAAAFEQAATADLELTTAAVEARTDPVDRLRAFFATYARAEQDWAFQLWLDAWAEAARRPTLRETSQRLNVLWQQVLATCIRDGVAGGAFVCPDPEGAAWRILSLLDGLALQSVAHRVPIDRSSVVTWSARFAEAELALPAGALGGPVPGAPTGTAVTAAAAAAVTRAAGPAGPRDPG